MCDAIRKTLVRQVVTVSGVRLPRDINALLDREHDSANA
jgi:hypothetical protein